MTVEYRETSFGRPVGEAKPVAPGTEVLLRTDNGLNLWHEVAGTTLRVDSPDSVTVTAFIGPLDMPSTFRKEKINEQHLQTSPFLSFGDLIRWRRRHFFWEEDK